MGCWPWSSLAARPCTSCPGCVKTRAVRAAVPAAAPARHSSRRRTIRCSTTEQLQQQAAAGTHTGRVSSSNYTQATPSTGSSSSNRRRRKLHTHVITTADGRCKPGRPRKQRPPLGTASSIAEELARSTGLPLEAASRLAHAQLANSSIPQEAAELQQRVLQLQRLLGRDGAARAISRLPGIMASRPEVLALHLHQWLYFFAPDGAPAEPGSKAEAQTLLRNRLAATPQLLAVNVENLVANLYEVGAIVHAEGLHAFAYKAMRLALQRPEVVQDKMRKVLLLLNSEARQQAQAEEATTNGLRKSSSLQAAVFSYEDLQKAARRDVRWLELSSDTLEARLQGVQQALQVPLTAVGRMFLKQPSLVTKSTALVAQRAAALAQLPGLGPGRAAAAVEAFPALLNLRPEVLQHRWSALQQAAATYPPWQQQLDGMPAATLAPLLSCADGRYSRLQQVVAWKQQPRRKLRTILCMNEQRFQAFAAVYQPQPLQQTQQLQRQGGSSIGEQQQGLLTIAEMQTLADEISAGWGGTISVRPYSHKEGGSSSDNGGIRMRCGEADVCLSRHGGLTHDMFWRALVKLCCCWSNHLQRYHLSDEQCRLVQARMPAGKWEQHVEQCRHPRMLDAAAPNINLLHVAGSTAVQHSKHGSGCI